MAGKAFAALGLTVGLGIGTAYGIHESAELRQEAARIEACDAANEQQGVPPEACADEVPSDTEIKVLRETGEAFAWFAIVSGIGTLIAGGVTLERIEHS